jgi:hypothetical protein
MSSEPQIAFLGVCERAEYNDQEMKWNIIGLKQHVLSYIYPISIPKVSIGLSIRNVGLSQTQPQNPTKIP